MDRFFDLVIRRGTIVDGGGGEPYQADLGIRDGRIAAIGADLAGGSEEIDAEGLLVTPGFVDLHTHYDGQVTWENRLVPSCAHGVTTAIIGNCGVGFAPCRRDAQDLLIRLMEGVEDIPHPVLVEGLRWAWESFPDYLDFLSGREFDMDVGAYLPHAPLRVYVMGDRAVRLEAATDDDLAEMAALAREGLDAGAMGIATSRTLFHRSSDGNPIPTLRASEEELVMLARAMRETGKGIFQLTGDAFGTADGVDLLRQLNVESGRAITFSTGTSNTAPYYWPALLDRVRDANQDGASLHPQILPRAIGVLLGFELTLNPFAATPTYGALTDLPLEERLTVLRRPEIKERILSEGAAIPPGSSIDSHIRQFQAMFQLGDPPRYEQPPEASIAGRAGRLGTTPDALAYDLLLEKEGRAQLYLAMANYPDGNLDAVSAMMRHPDTLPGLGDGGAHCATICDGSYSTFLLTYHARDREGDRLSVPEAVRKLTAAPAAVIGLHDRGRIARGYKADINIIDFDRLAIHAPTVAHDLPGGGRRLVQRATGYRATIVNGVPVYLDGEPTGALPGRIVRGGRPTPAAIH